MSLLTYTIRFLLVQILHRLQLWVKNLSALKYFPIYFIYKNYDFLEKNIFKFLEIFSIKSRNNYSLFFFLFLHIIGVQFFFEIGLLTNKS